MNRIKAAWAMLTTGECPMCDWSRRTSRNALNLAEADRRADLNWIAIELAQIQALRDKQHWRPRAAALMEAIKARLQEVS